MKRLCFLGGTVALFAADQLAKASVEDNMKVNEEKPLADKVILRRSHNRGMCLNLLEKKPGAVRVLSLGSAAVLTAIYFCVLCRKKHFWKKAGLSVMTAGAWRNTVDPLARGYVVDYIGFKSSNKKVQSITYNVGDFCIGAGGLLLMLISAFPGGKRTEKDVEEAEVPRADS